MNSPRFWIGLVLIVLGALWVGQGLGWIGGGGMSGVAFWAVVGAVLIVVGAVLVVPVVRRRG